MSPSSLPILGSPYTISLAQALDEHGLPDPLALIRKPISEVLAKIEEEPVRRSAFEPSDPLDFLASDTSAAMQKLPSVPGLDTPLSGNQDAEGDVDEILRAGRPSPKSPDADPWLIRSVSEAQDLTIYPRSVDRSVVGLGEDTMRELEGLERELGSERPKTAAMTMQKVVASQVTPHTVGHGDLTEQEIDAMFNNLLTKT